MTPALLVLDPQNGFFAADNPHRRRFLATVPVINGAIRHFHARGWPVYFIQHTSPTKPHGSRAWAVYAEFVRGPGDICLDKRHHNAFWESDLDTHLRAQQVGFVLISGFLAEFCILSTYRGALERGYQAAVLREGIASMNDGHTQFVEAICRQMAPAELDTPSSGDESVKGVPLETQSDSDGSSDGKESAAQETVGFLATVLDETYHHLCQQVVGLTAEEFFWEPADECWTLRRLTDGNWSLDYEETPADPAPVPTIAWRLVHVAACKVMYHEYAFGPGRLTWDNLSLPGTVDRALAWLEEGQQQLTSALGGLTDRELETLRPTNWGELWPTWRLFWTLAAHDLEHGAEIGLLRQIYRSSAGANGAGDE